MKKLPEALTQETVARLYREGFLSAFNAQTSIVLDAQDVRYVDGAGIAFLIWLERRCKAKGGSLELHHLLPSVATQLDHYRAEEARIKAQKENCEPSYSSIARLGEGLCKKIDQCIGAVAFFGALIFHMLHLMRGHICWREGREAFIRAGVQAVPVAMMMGFLLGVILAFQSAIPLEMFGAESFVGGLVGIALVRELGLIITAILVAGRTGSAFAAEMGTMKVNEELDALETMGLNPIRFLALPRILAGTFALPFLSLFTTFAGLVGGWVVMTILGFSFTIYIDQLVAFVAFGDFIGSLAKAFVFGFALSAVGCRCGLMAEKDAQGVGRATTSAVVSGIVLVAILEGVFSILFYAMGW
jgi:phospholipid/cholesterol/gamma-HCH transport system permease protein